MQKKTYILKKNCPNIGKEVGDYYNNEYAESIEELLQKGVIEEEVMESPKLLPCDDSTTHITIPTPEDWKCERQNCTTDFYHEHSSYPSLASHPSSTEPDNAKGDTTPLP